jgi:hypothetical protein
MQLESYQKKSMVPSRNFYRYKVVIRPKMKINVKKNVNPLQKRATLKISAILDLCAGVLAR